MTARGKSVAGSVAGVLLTLTLNGATAAPPASTSEATDATSRLIVRLRPDTAPNSFRSARDRARRLTDTARMPLRGSRELGRNMVALALRTPLEGDALATTLDELRADPDVEFAEVDRRRFVRTVPSDSLYASQWYLQGVETAATNFEAAWNVTTGAADTVVAVLDTGVRFDHPDLTSRLLPGYDFVSGETSSSFVSANDGDDWDSDASDPGDWVSTSEASSGPLAGCDVSPSSWHGTRVAAIVGATTNNSTGVAGGTWTGGVLPVRVLGKCGGYDSDIVAGMRWAAGLPVAGVPTNPHPAKVLNLSLGSTDSCSTIYLSALADLTAAGVVVVASAGNASGPVEAPANCPGVVAVGGLRHVGTKVGYSSLGPEVALSAPAGNCPNVNTTFLCGFSLITADDTGLTVPVSSSYTDEANYNIGTSFSAPVVAAVAALMFGVNDHLSTAEITARLESGARPFPAPEPGLPTCPSLDSATGQCNCTTTTCGAGMADAPGAVAEALRPIARVVKPAGNGAGQNVTLNGASSAAARNRTINTFAWSGVSGSPVFVGGTSGQTATVVVPVSGQVVVRLRVTDDLGRVDTQDVSLGVAARSGGGGGGGATHPLMLAALALLLVRRRLQR